MPVPTPSDRGPAQATADATAHATAHATTDAAASPGAAPRKTARRAAAPRDELAARRLERLALERQADERFESFLHRETIAIPRAYPYITGSLGSARLLHIVELASRDAEQATGSPWVRQPEQRWLDCTTLLQEEWLEARRVLREMALVLERRYYDLELRGLNTEFAFNASAFAQAVADLRDNFRNEFRAVARSRSASRGPDEPAQAHSN